MTGYDLNDTIAAIATSPGESGIGIIRVSGKTALRIADEVFIAKDKHKPSTFKTYTVHYGWIVSRDQQEIVDEVILTVMRGPGSYTREDTVEINCHGGVLALRRVLDLILECGCRMAQPGEFTKRAFLHGRIDLAQAEAVLDIIKAKTERALISGMEQLKGVLSKKINQDRAVLVGLLAELEAGIDFPEEEIAAFDLQRIFRGLRKVEGDLNALLANARYGRVLREGIKAVICGKPNTGKSSLLNALLRQERSIVTPIAGTTRDTIEEVIDIKGIPVRIVDTAGIIEPRDLVEKEAIRRSREYIRTADLVIFLFDGSRKLDKEDKFIMRKVTGKHVLAIVNKMDLRQKIEREKIPDRFGELIDIGAKRGKNLERVEDAIVDFVFSGRSAAGESLLAVNRRHSEEIREAQKLIAGAAGSLDNKVSAEFVAQDIRDALRHLDRILGKDSLDSLLNKIFSEFCVGK